MKNIILFDFGNTLVQYYVRSQFPGILKQAITGVRDCLNEEGALNVSEELMWKRVEEENYESEDHSVRPLEDRLTRIFQLDDSAVSTDAMMTMCRRFMEPIFAIARRYDDVLPVLGDLGESGIRKAIISNTPWGSPAKLWSEEIGRLGLREQVELVVLCRDVGWRKPARQVFEYALERLRAEPQECVFVGDDPGWDLAGPRAVGMEAILMDRRGVTRHAEEKPIRDLHELLKRI